MRQTGSEQVSLANLKLPICRSNAVVEKCAVVNNYFNYIDSVVRQLSNTSQQLILVSWH